MLPTLNRLVQQGLEVLVERPVAKMEFPQYEAFDGSQGCCCCCDGGGGGGGGCTQCALACTTVHGKTDTQ